MHGDLRSQLCEARRDPAGEPDARGGTRRGIDATTGSWLGGGARFDDALCWKLTSKAALLRLFLTTFESLKQNLG